jgi:hypothetical protein
MQLDLVKAHSNSRSYLPEFAEADAESLDNLTTRKYVLIAQRARLSATRHPHIEFAPLRPDYPHHAHATAKPLPGLVSQVGPVLRRRRNLYHSFFITIFRCFLVANDG